MNNTKGNNRPKRPRRQAGGQHAATIGDSNLHHQCPHDFSVALKRAAKRFDIDLAPTAEPQVDAGWLAAFEVELNRVIAEGGFDVPYGG